MGLRHPNARLVKIHRNYSVEDISRLFRLHKNTVRNWLKEGLTAIDDRRPTRSYRSAILTHFVLDCRKQPNYIHVQLRS
jgi:hypothetical protein